MPVVLKAGQTISENCCKCHNPVTGVINGKGIAEFNCTTCNHAWKYSMRSNKGSRFSTADLHRILKKGKLTIANSTK